MSTQYVNNLLYHQHIHHILLEIKFLKWFNQWPTGINKLIQQLVTTLVPTIIHVNTSLLTYVPKSSAHQALDGGQPRNSSGISSPEGNPLMHSLIHPLIHYWIVWMANTWPTYVYTTMVSTTYCIICTITNNQTTIHEATISNLCQRH
jgi:hypothetical protein